MKITAIEEVTTRKEVLQRTECDRCSNPDVDTGGMYEVFECSLEIKTGWHFPEGRDVETVSMDLCPTCTEALKSLLLANGYRLNTTHNY